LGVLRAAARRTEVLLDGCVHGEAGTIEKPNGGGRGGCCQIGDNLRGVAPVAYSPACCRSAACFAEAAPTKPRCAPPVPPTCRCLRTAARCAPCRRLRAR